MGIFNNLFKTNPKNLDNVELAYQLLLQDCAKDPKYKKAVQNIFDSFTKDENGYWNRTDWLMKVINLAGTPDTPKQRYILSTAYYYLGSKYRKEAITHLELYISGGIWDGLFLYSPTHTLYDYRKQTLANTMYWLGECYEKEYLFESALKTYEKIIEVLPNYPSGYLGKVSILTKTNNLDECLKWLNLIKKSSLYKDYFYYDELGKKYKNTEFKESIDKMINKTMINIEKNYVYRPRKTK